MELKLTTKRAMAYEAKTGNDIISKMQEISDTGRVTIKDAFQLFEAMGDNNTVEVFDAWDASFVDKTTAIFNEVKRFIGGDTEKK